MAVIGVHKSAVGVGKLELRAGNQCAGHAVLLQNDQCSSLFVGEGKGLNLTLLNFDGLGGAVQHIALHGLHLAGGNGAAGSEVVDGDAPVSIGDILAVAWANRGTVIVRHQELDTFQRLVVGSGDKLLDHQRCAGGVVEGQLLCIIGIDHNRLAAAGLVNHIAGKGLDLCDHQRPHHTGNGDLAVGIGIIEAIGGNSAAFIGHKFTCGGSDLEGDAFQRLIGKRILLLDQQGSGAGVFHNDSLCITAAPDYHIGGRGVDHIAIRRLDFIQHIGAGGQIGDLDFSLRVRGENAVLGQRGCANHTVQPHLTSCGGGNAELRTAQRLAGGAVPLLDDDGPFRLILKGQGHGAPLLDLHRLALRVQNETSRGAGFRHHHALARCQPGNEDFAIFIGAVHAVAVTHDGSIRIQNLELGVL